MIVDTHTHLYLEEFEGRGADAVDRAVAAGVGMMVFPNVNAATFAPMMALHHERPDVTAVAVGLHPTEVDDSQADSLLAFVEEALASGERFVAVGEIGIDLYWDKTHRSRQMEVFDSQMRLAASLGLPAIIHCREGLAETLEVIDGLGEECPGAVFHSFGGTVEDVEAIRRRGDFLFGINGIVTFKNSRLRDVLPVIGIDRILLETDSPYLAPVPHRGRRNESAYIIHTAAYIASALGLTPSEVADTTTANARRFFHL